MCVPGAMPQNQALKWGQSCREGEEGKSGEKEFIWHDKTSATWSGQFDTLALQVGKWPVFSVKINL